MSAPTHATRGAFLGRTHRSPIPWLCQCWPVMTEEIRGISVSAFRRAILLVGADRCVRPDTRHLGHVFGAHTPVRPYRILPILVSPIPWLCQCWPVMTEEIRGTSVSAFRRAILLVGADRCVRPIIHRLSTTIPIKPKKELGHGIEKQLTNEDL